MTATASAPSTRPGRDIGAPPTLPLRLAIQVAWTSIRVRLSRSLVTVSSVVLAVAFLLSVLGENVVNLAVHRAWQADSASLVQAQELRETLERQRQPLALLALLAEDPQATLAWAASTVPAGTPAPAVPAVDAGAAATALELARWVDALKPSQAYLVRRNRTLDQWLLALDPAGVDALLATVKDFKGVRLTIPRERLLAVAAATPALREALAVLTAAEARRIDQVAAAGGPDTVLDLVRSGAEPARLSEAGLPIHQLLPALYGPAAGAEGLAGRDALARQLRLDRARTHAVETVTRLNAIDPSLLTAEDVRWDALAAALTAPAAKSPAQQLADASALSAASLADREAALAALNRTLAGPSLYRKDSWSRITLDDEADGLVKRPKLSDRQQTRLNRLLLQAALPQAFAPAPPPKPVELRQVLAGKADADPRTPQVLARLQAAGDVSAAELASELDRRARLSELEQTFARLDYSPERSSERTFWLVVLSLLVCIVGIVNTMMMAVTERFREIATMKCLGAMDSFVLKAFMIESGAVGSVGSLIGAVIGAVIVLIQGSARFGAPFWSSFPAAGLAVAAGIALICGLCLAIVGALLPALKAARMHPIEAMRIDA